MSNQHNLDFILNHLGEEREKYLGATVPPIFQTSNFIFNNVDELSSSFKNEMQSYLYTRGNNPTVEILRKKLAALEKTEAALVFPSGIAAITMAILSNVQAGDHIICVANSYSWTQKFLVDFLPKFKIHTSFVNGKLIENIKGSKKDNTRMLVLESPTSLTFEIQDLAACSKWAKANNILTLIDNSYASPIYQTPSDFGIDMMAHSGTKYLNGHSDVVFGALCGSEENIEKIFNQGLMTLGSKMSPHEAFLAIRGLRTLGIRMEKIASNTKVLFDYLKTRKWVKKIYFPFDPDNDQYTLAKKQMKDAPGLISIELKASDTASIEEFIHQLNYFKMAVSWGGHESLILPLLSIHKAFPNNDHRLPIQFIRLYIGLEDSNNLMGDLNNASQFLK